MDRVPPASCPVGSTVLAKSRRLLFSGFHGGHFCFFAVTMREMLHSFNLTQPSPLIFRAQLLFTQNRKSQTPLFMGFRVLILFCHVGSFIIQNLFDLFMDTMRPRTRSSREPCGLAVGFTEVAFD